MCFNSAQLLLTHCSALRAYYIHNLITFTYIILPVILMILITVNLVFTLFFIHLCGSLEDKEFWTSSAKNELMKALKLKWNDGTAKNIILFVGDGMDVNTITAARIYNAGEQSSLVFDSFPHIALLKTYCTDKQVPDSASTATALFSGVKINYQTVGVQAAVKLNDCNASLLKENQLDSIITWAQRSKKKTGFVTTTRVTHATPAAIYAHSANRKWECKISSSSNSPCKDIARQLIEDETGRNLNVIMGGGRQSLVSNVTAKPKDPIDSWACYRTDGRNLIEDWKSDKRTRGVSFKVLENTGDLEALNENTDYVLGVFSNSHLNMDYLRDTSSDGMPSLQQMTSAALNLLQNEDNGFILIVEGGLIDYAHHRGHARMALDETVAFNRAIEFTINWLIKKHISEQTLVIVTADHSHDLVFSGNPERGNNILGVNKNPNYDKTPYTTLSYGTGGSNNYQFRYEDGLVKRQDPSLNDTTDFQYSQQAAILHDEVKHGGGDVVAYAKGPMAHLLHSVHEQNYVAYVIAYAAKIGPFAPSGSPSLFVTLSLLISFNALLLIFC